ncbi:MAG TPA: Dabb family protein [Stellaceae bacterium]|nr:Dabb family protein [Stellaceae bacterium]
MPIIKHIVMWDVLGRSAEERAGNIDRIRTAFEGMRGKIPGLTHLEIGVDTSRIDYACDVVLYTEFSSQDACEIYASHPEHLRVRAEIEGLRIARHQVDYAVG